MKEGGRRSPLLEQIPRIAREMEGDSINGSRDANMQRARLFLQLIIAANPVRAIQDIRDARQDIRDAHLEAEAESKPEAELLRPATPAATVPVPIPASKRQADFWGPGSVFSSYWRPAASDNGPIDPIRESQHDLKAYRRSRNSEIWKETVGDLNFDEQGDGANGSDADASEANYNCVGPW